VPQPVTGRVPDTGVGAGAGAMEDVGLGAGLGEDDDGGVALGAGEDAVWVGLGVGVAV
jgi:hypothetical protein